MRIPRNLKPGDKLWYSKTRFSVVGPTEISSKTPPYFTDGLQDRSRGRIYAFSDYDGGHMNYWCDTGEEIHKDTPPIIRVERVVSKGDKDATWLLRFVSVRVPMLKLSEVKRIRAIANRLDMEGV